MTDVKRLAKLLEAAEDTCCDEQEEYRYYEFMAEIAMRHFAAEVDARDAVITEILDFIKKTCTVEYNMNGGVIRGSRTYAMACEIAGRTE